MKKFLATEIDKFCQDFDLYEYQDTECSVNDIYKMISNNIFDIIAFFEYILEENSDDEILNHAKLILNDLYYYQRGEIL